MQPVEQLQCACCIIVKFQSAREEIFENLRYKFVSTAWSDGLENGSRGYV